MPFLPRIRLNNKSHRLRFSATIIRAGIPSLLRAVIASSCAMFTGDWLAGASRPPRFWRFSVMLCVHVMLILTPVILSYV